MSTIRISKIIPINSTKEKDREQSTSQQNTAPKEINPEESVFFNTLKPMLTPEALTVVLRKEN